ncbi:MAG TPA: OsmC family peroxiredoxin [Luteibaculaceae bacterium]|nr:OsmC family peroxiredoxin [Luteibaculaceae bacterium]
MAIIRRSTAVWQGTGKDGNGRISSQSGVLKDTPYNFGMRFGDQPGTNPEELIASAHAGCFSMKLAFNLQGIGVDPKEIKTDCAIVFEEGTIVESRLKVHVMADGLDQTAFEAQVKDAEVNCPISKLLNAKISVEAKLNG